jgi:cell division protein FtsB
MTKKELELRNDKIEKLLDDLYTVFVEMEEGIVESNSIIAQLEAENNVLEQENAQLVKEINDLNTK